jgi:hypothetical protein
MKGRQKRGVKFWKGGKGWPDLVTFFYVERWEREKSCMGY